MRWIAWFGRSTLLLVALGVALVVGSGQPAQSANVTISFDPSPKVGPLEAAYYGADNVDVFTLNVGDVAARTWRAQGFKLPSTTKALRVGLWLKKNGVPTDNLTVEIRTNAGGLPSSTVVPNGTSNPVAASSLSSSDFKLITFTFATPPQLTGGTQYHLVLKRSGSLDSFSYYLWGADQSAPSYANGAASVYNSSTWAATSPATDHAFGVNQTRIDVVVGGLESGDNLGAYKVTVAYDPAVVTPLAIQDGGFLGSTGRTVSCVPQYEPGTVRLSCYTISPPPPLGPIGSGILATINFGPVAAGSSGLQLVYAGNCEETCITRFDATAIAHTPLTGSLTMKSLGLATGDSDRDGCSDLEEAGDDILKGGDRDWTNAWDFYDVPVPVNPDPTPNGTRDRSIDMSDVIAVLFYVGATENGPLNGNLVDYDSLKDGDWNGDTVVNNLDKVGRRYDRTAAAPTSGAPDGAISLSDVIAVLGQSGHSCHGP